MRESDPKLPAKGVALRLASGSRGKTQGLRSFGRSSSHGVRMTNHGRVAVG